MRSAYSKLVLLSLGSFAMALAAACSAQTPDLSSNRIERVQPVSSAIPAPAPPAKAGSLQQNYARLPLSFEANRGQADPRVKFIARGSGYSLFLTDSSAVLALSRAQTTTSHPQTGPEKQPQALREAAKSWRTDVIRMELVGARRDPSAQEEDKLPGKMNYFIGRDPAKWHTGVPTYARVRYSAVYPGIGLVYYGNQSQLEYDFLVAPHADPRAIRLRFAGAQRLALTADGDLSIAAPDGEIAFHKPTVYQEIDGRRQPVDGRFQLAGKTVGFALGAYNHSAPLIIDPVLGYSTYLGGSGPERATALSLDSSGNAYITGFTFSANFPLGSSPYQGTNFNTANGSAFVTKLNATGTALVYSTYLGGSGGCATEEVAETFGDVANAIAVDGSGEAYVAGQTCSPDFPITAGAFQTSLKDSQRANVFVTKLSSEGSELVYSTYIGGSGGGSNPGDGDMAEGIAVDNAGNAYVAGQAFSHDYPTTPGAFQTVSYACCNAAFVTKLNPSGSGLAYSTFIGSGYGSSDAAFAIAIDPRGDAYITGYTFAGSFPVTSNAFEPNDAGAQNNTSNAFVTEINPSGSGLLYSTYLGGTGFVHPNGELGRAIAVDASGNAYVTGSTYSYDFPTTAGAFQTTNHAPVGSDNAFISKVDTVSGALVYSTYLGGSQSDEGTALALDGSGSLYLTGDTYSSDFPVTALAYQSTNHAQSNKTTSAFLTELNAAGTELIYSTYLGGSGSASGSNCGSEIGTAFRNTNGDMGNSIALASSGAVYLAGATCSANFPTTQGSLQPATGATSGGSNSFVAAFELAAPATITTLSASANPQSSGQWVTFTATVAAADASTLPTGSVTFSVDGDAVPGVQLNAGEATWTTYSLAKGSHIIEATYSGSSTFSASTSNSLKEAIVPPPTGESTLPAPMFSPNPGKYTGSVPLMLADTNPDAQIYYTVGGSAPALYTSPIALQPGYTTVEAFASAAGYDPSPIARASYTVIAEAPAPVLSPGSGSYAPGQEVAISDANPTATIRYTTDGSMPTTRSTLYTRTLVLTGVETIRAIAVAAGDAASPAASATYTPE